MAKNSLKNLNKNEYSDFLSPDSFVKLDAEIQDKIISGINDNKSKEGGILGRFFGTKPMNIAMNIAFMICAILFFIVVVDFIRICIQGESFNMELLKTIIPVITLSLGYIFGKGFENNK